MDAAFGTRACSVAGSQLVLTLRWTVSARQVKDLGPEPVLTRRRFVTARQAQLFQVLTCRWGYPRESAASGFR